MKEIPENVAAAAAAPRQTRSRQATGEAIELPAATSPSLAPLEYCLRVRRSTRDYAPEPVSLEQVSQLLWAAQGVTSPAGLRTAPSAGAIYPLRSYLVVGNVEGLTTGFYSFNADQRRLTLQSKGDKRKQLAKLTGGQQCVEQCACALLLMGWYKRIEREFGDTGARLAAIEAGHIGQNFCLEAAALGLGSIGVGKFDEAGLRMLLHLPEDEHPLYMLLAGRVL